MSNLKTEGLVFEKLPRLPDRNTSNTIAKAEIDPSYRNDLQKLPRLPDLQGPNTLATPEKHHSYRKDLQKLKLPLARVYILKYFKYLLSYGCFGVII